MIVPLLNPKIGLTVEELIEAYENPADDHDWGVINVAHAVFEALNKAGYLRVEPVQVQFFRSRALVSECLSQSPHHLLRRSE